LLLPLRSTLFPYTTLFRSFLLPTDGRHAGQYSVGLQVGDGRDRHAPYHHSARQTLTEVDALEDILPLRIQVADQAASPALSADFVRFAGMPDIHRTKVRAGRVGVANAMDDGDLALVIELFHRPHVRVEGQGIVNGQHLVLGDTHIRPVIPVEWVGIG